MHPSDIVATLRRCGSSVSQIARDVGVSQPSASAVVNGANRSERIENRIAEITGLGLHEIWPKWHKPPKGSEQRSSTGAEIHVTTLGIIEQHLDRELMRRVPDLPVPFTIRIRHVAMVYNGVAARRPRADNMLDVIEEEVERYVGMHDDPEGPSLKRIFLRDFSGAQAAATKETAPRTQINNAGAQIGKQLNLSGDGQTLVLGKRIKNKPK